MLLDYMITIEYEIAREVKKITFEMCLGDKKLLADAIRKYTDQKIFKGAIIRKITMEKKI